MSTQCPSTPAPPSPSPKKLPPAHALVEAKRRLAEMADVSSLSADRTNKAIVDAVSRRPYAAASAALAAGAVVGYFPPLRKLMLIAAGWGAKRAVNQYMRSYAARRRK